MIIHCHNGKFRGVKEPETGVVAFKGVPYAQPPIGELRWKATRPAEPSDELYDAVAFGKSGIQYERAGDPASANEIGEDCLTLNIWMNNTEDSGRPILFFIHGGSFAWGGTADPGYSGQYIVKEHNDVIVISANYRVGMMGLVDLSAVPDGKKYKVADFPDCTNLMLLDIQQALKWVHQNAVAFGGDADNITVFGESAGSMIMAAMLASASSKGLFRRAIAQSGALNYTSSKKDYEAVGTIQSFMRASGAKDLDDLMEMSEEDLIKYYTKRVKYEDGTKDCPNDHMNLPMRGGTVVPDDPYTALENGSGCEVDLLVGTNADEWRFWLNLIGGYPLSELSEEKREKAVLMFKKLVAGRKYNIAVKTLVKSGYADSEEQASEKLEQYLDTVEIYNPGAFSDIMSAEDERQMWRGVHLGNEENYRQPSIRMAEAHIKGVRYAGGSGKTYMYHFGKHNGKDQWAGANHVSELSYVFHNTEHTVFCGPVDRDLADLICSAWVNFAKTGDPTPDQDLKPAGGNALWTEYDLDTRATMCISADGGMKMETADTKAFLRDNELLKVLRNKNMK